jgi:adenosylcobinamide-GDP ribazoletransferase
VDLRRRHRVTAAVTPPGAVPPDAVPPDAVPPGAPAWRVVVSMFTIVPVAGPAEVGKPAAARAVAGLPVLGALLGCVASGVLIAAQASGDSPERRLLAAALAIGVLAVLTGGLHLDGLADTADGLGSRQGGQQALAIMRKSDVGPMGVAALMFVVLAQILALAALTPGWRASLALVAAAVTGRVAVLLATAEPAARPDGFGALISGATRPVTRAVMVAALLGVVLVTGTVAAGLAYAGSCAGAVLAGLVASVVFRRFAVRRLGGMTGDVFGAIIEVCAAVVLVVTALFG